MAYALVFQSGNSQALRLPEEFHLSVAQVEIFRRGDEIMPREKPISATALFDTLTTLPEDFLSEGREDELPQEREHL